MSQEQAAFPRDIRVKVAFAVKNYFNATAASHWSVSAEAAVKLLEVPLELTKPPGGRPTEAAAALFHFFGGPHPSMQILLALETLMLRWQAKLAIPVPSESEGENDPGILGLVKTFQDWGMRQNAPQRPVAHREFQEFENLINEALASADSGFFFKTGNLTPTLQAAPPPEWLADPRFDVQEELRLSAGLRRLTAELTEVRQVKALLFEQGAALEQAVRYRLRVLGFQTGNLHKDGSEFDVLFESEEGRGLGEVEGRDNRAISVDKFRQLFTNVDEDRRIHPNQPRALGVLFGNGYRLQHPADRKPCFTEKVLASAVESKFALLPTSGLFAPVEYLIVHPDRLDYAKQCRASIFNAAGTLVQFPPVPTD